MGLGSGVATRPPTQTPTGVGPGSGLPQAILATWLPPPCIGAKEGFSQDLEALPPTHRTAVGLKAERQTWHQGGAPVTLSLKGNWALDQGRASVQEALGVGRVGTPA